MRQPIQLFTRETREFDKCAHIQVISDLDKRLAGTLYQIELRFWFNLFMW